VRDPSRYELWYGRDEPPAESRELRSGALVAQLESIDLRYVEIGGSEVVRRLFVAVRDAAWGTIPPAISGLEVEADGAGFRVSFEAFHEAGDLRFRWRGDLAAREGALECTMEGVAESDFLYNRIGFCVLHPGENAGRPYRARTPDGEIEGALPDDIGPQRLEDGKLWPLFPSYTGLEIEVADGLWAKFEFEGDLFEMEDQRNWTDASFKTYSTQLTLGWPHQAKAGQRIVQKVRLTARGATGAPSGDRDGPVRIELGEPSRTLLPTVGLGLASHGDQLSERETDLILALGPDHLRADLRLAGSGWRAELDRAAGEALATGAGLELAAFLGDEPEAELDALAAALPLAQAKIERILVFKEGEPVTGSSWVRLTRERLGAAAPSAKLAGGTDGWFTDLNRDRPELEGAGAVAYSICATVHADDDTSVRETPAAQGDTVRSTRALYGALPIVVGPVTIKPRFWPFGDTGAGALPFQVDARQCSLFGAAWTVASLKHLVEAGVASLTYFETTGWRGVLERDRGSPLPNAFPSRPGTVFPLYHVLADYGEWRGWGAVVPVRSSRPLAVEALGVRTDEGPHVLVANLTPAPQRCAVGLFEGATVSVRVLDETTALLAGSDPQGFRSRRETRRTVNGTVELELAAYAVVRVDP
jgi:hypothetical protein